MILTEPPEPFVVLLVEDEPDDIFLAKHAFRRVAPEAALEVARTTQEALIALARKVPDIVLLDVKLPGQDGLDFLKTVREDARYDGLPVFVLSTSAERRDVKRAYDLGATAYLTKPGEPVAMREVVEGLRAFLATRRTA